MSLSPTSVAPRLVILGCGYIGTALAKEAIGKGQSVAALTRNVAKADELRAMGVGPVVVADLAADAWHGQLDPADAAIVNCVAPASADPAGYRHSFIDGAKSISRWLEKSVAAGHVPAREVIFTSATSVYPQTDGGWVDEDTAVDLAVLSPSAAILHEAELIFLALPTRLSRRVWVMRLAGLFGPSRHYLLDVLRAGQKSFPGGGHWVNLLHRDDAVTAIRAALSAQDNIFGGVYNVADDEPVLKRDLVAWLASALGIDAASLQFDAAKSSRSQRRQNAAGEVPHRRISNQRLRNSLGWQPAYPSCRAGYGQITLDGRTLPQEKRT